MEENKNIEKEAEIVEKEYYTKSEVDAIITKKLLDFSTQLFKRIDEPKKVEVVEKKEPTFDDYKF